MGMSLLDLAAILRFAGGMACGIAGACSALALEPPHAGIVTNILDGDTIKMQSVEGPVTVRLRNIDAPELNQPGGNAATRALHGRILGQEVSLRDVTRDSEQRWTAVVHLGDENINGWMVKQGHAWAYRGHTREPDYCVWEQAARALRRGLWADRHWTSPWDWRTSKQDSTYFVSDYSNATSASCIREISGTLSFDE
jgi:endonuclease YncB( thermonuclease family)